MRVLPPREFANSINSILLSNDQRGPTTPSELTNSPLSGEFVTCDLSNLGIPRLNLRFQNFGAQKLYAFLCFPYYSFILCFSPLLCPEILPNLLWQATYQSKCSSQKLRVFISLHYPRAPSCPLFSEKATCPEVEKSSPLKFIKLEVGTKWSCFGAKYPPKTNMRMGKFTI